MHHQAHGYFGMIDIRNVGNQVIPNALVLSALQNLSKNSQEVQNVYDRLHSDMAAKTI